MNLNDIGNLYAYNQWASDRMFAALEKITEEQFHQKIQSSFPSLQETVFHILGAEWIWLKRWQGASPRAAVTQPTVSSATWNTLSPAPPPMEQLATVGALQSVAGDIAAERSEFLAGLDEARLQAPLSYSDMSGKPFSQPLANLMQHVGNHGTYHRGQVATMLRQLGAQPPSLDLVYFYRERQPAAAAS